MNEKEEEMTKLVALTGMSIYEIKCAFANIERTTDEFAKGLDALEVALHSNNWRKMHGYPKRRRAKNECMYFGKRRLQELNRELRRDMRPMQYLP